MRPNLGKRAIGFLWVLLLGYSSTLAPTSLSLGIVCGLLGLTVFGSFVGKPRSVSATLLEQAVDSCDDARPALPEDIEQEPSWAKALL